MAHELTSKAKALTSGLRADGGQAGAAEPSTCKTPAAAALADPAAAGNAASTAGQGLTHTTTTTMAQLLQLESRVRLSCV